MSAISPIVGVSKIINQYSTIVVGFDGVLYNGNELKFEAVKALSKAKAEGKNIVLLSNCPLRVPHIIKIFQKNNVPVEIFSLIMSAGEIARILLKKSPKFSNLGKKYFCLGANFENILDTDSFERVDDINQADFIYVGGLKNENECVANYQEIMQVGASLNLPMLCVGNDIYRHINGVVCEANAAFAEQYAMTGGQIYTFGKPDPKVLSYVLEPFERQKENILIVGDNMQTDIKMANLCDMDSLLITHGIHKELLGNGYIPDLQKAKDLAADYGVYLKYIISDLRW